MKIGRGDRQGGGVRSVTPAACPVARQTMPLKDGFTLDGIRREFLGARRVAGCHRREEQRGGEKQRARA